MIETDKTVFEKMVGIWSITQIPQLKMIPNAGMVTFTWAKGPIAEMEFKMFDALEPLEIVTFIEFEIGREYGINAKQFRCDLSGYSVNPFSSQRSG
jgi:hypothetical protein|tara:strand:- start:543 stop:830 length:288 start_codon:yes stop_codon:yes gene_type:complete